MPSGEGSIKHDPLIEVRTRIELHSCPQWHAAAAAGGWNTQLCIECRYSTPATVGVGQVTRNTLGHIAGTFQLTLGWMESVLLLAEVERWDFFFFFREGMSNGQGTFAKVPSKSTISL